MNGRARLSPPDERYIKSLGEIGGEVDLSDPAAVRALLDAGVPVALSTDGVPHSMLFATPALRSSLAIGCLRARRWATSTTARSASDAPATIAGTLLDAASAFEEKLLREWIARKTY